MSAILEAKGLDAFYGSTHVLKGVDFSVEAGGITTILGANGAGKTTILRAISRMVRTNGQIAFAGRRIDGFSTERVARSGIAHVPDGRGTLSALTVEENLRIGAYTKRDRAGKGLDRVYAYFPRLKERKQQQAGTLSGGEQQMLAIGRALMLHPTLLLLDEPSFGLAPLVIREIFAIMKAINEEDKVSILLVEQNVGLALKVAARAYLLETGAIVMSGTSREFQENTAIQHSYLGIS